MSSSELGLPARAGSSSSQVGFLTTNTAGYSRSIQVLPVIPWGFWPSLSDDKNIWVAAPLWCSNMSVMISIFERVKTFHPRITGGFLIEITFLILFGGILAIFRQTHISKPNSIPNKSPQGMPLAVTKHQPPTTRHHFVEHGGMSFRMGNRWLCWTAGNRLNQTCTLPVRRF